MARGYTKPQASAEQKVTLAEPHFAHATGRNGTYDISGLAIRYYHNGIGNVAFDPLNMKGGDLNACISVPAKCLPALIAALTKLNDEVNELVKQTWFVIEDEDGPYLTQTPQTTDTILFQSLHKDFAERELARACNG